jgi:phosphoribosylformylglycinamidine (FGAM) synthase-like amidotransferase family enzyme
VEARSLDADRTWNLIVRLKDDQNAQRLNGEKRFASKARGYLRTLKSNKNVVQFIDYYGNQIMHGSNPNDSFQTIDVIVHAVRDHITRNGEGHCEVILKAVKT